MICVGKSRWQPNWELCSPGIRHQQQSLGPRDLEKQQQLRSVHSSLDFAAGKSSPNELHNLTLPSQTQQRLRYGPALAFRSSKIIDLLAQDPSITVESKVYSFRKSSASSGIFLQPSQFNFGHANSGQNLFRPDELSSVTRGDTKVRAERVSRKPSQESSDNWKKTYGEEDYGGSGGGSSIWDGNAENVRRRRFTKPNYSLPDLEENSSPSFRERNSGSQKNEWDYGSEESPSFRERNNRSQKNEWDNGSEESSSFRERNNRSQKNEWGYGSEESSSFRERNNRSQQSEWDYESEEADSDDESNEEEDDDDEEEDPSWLSWLLNDDIKEAFTLMRWGLPAAFLLGTALLSSAIGNPLTLLFGFTIFPSAVKFLNPYAKEIFRYVANPFGSSSSKRRKTRTRPASSTYNRRSQDTAIYPPDFRSPSQTISTRYDSDVPKQEARSSTRSALGGWDDLVEDRSRSNRQSQWPLQKRPKSKKKLAKREQPLLIRLLLAFFPFLRSWGGSL